jgi:hypothetical protein
MKSKLFQSSPFSQPPKFSRSTSVDASRDFVFDLRHVGAFENAADVEFDESGGGVVCEVG